MFTFAAGNYYMKGAIVPSTGDTFTGAGTGPSGTVLLGSTILPSSHFIKTSNGQWRDTSDPVFDTTSLADADDPNRNDPVKPVTHCVAYPQGKANPGTCDYPDLIYSDGSMLVRQLGPDPAHPCKAPMPTTTARTYCINYGSGTIFLGGSPARHTITYSGVADPTGSLLRNAFRGTATNVTIDQLTVTQYANTYNGHGAIVASDAWIVNGVLVSQNHACGVTISGQSAPTTVESSTLLSNGQEGFCGASVGTVFSGNIVNNNNVDGFDPSWNAGGGKFANSTNITVTGNTFSNNNGSGLWFDVGDSQISVTNNVSTNNISAGGNGGGEGIRVEVSCKAALTGNVTSGNARGGINVVNSQDVTVSGNTVSSNAKSAIRIGATNRIGSSANCGAQNVATNDVVTNNTITMGTNSIVGVVAYGGCVSCVDGDGFSGNTYSTGGNCGANLWKWWDGSSEQIVAFSTGTPNWQGTYGQDTVLSGGTCS